MEKLEKCINQIPNIISGDNIINFVNNNKENYDLPCAFIDDYIFDHTKLQSDELNYLKIPEDIADKNVKEFFPELKENMENFKDLK